MLQWLVYGIIALLGLQSVATYKEIYKGKTLEKRVLLNPKEKIAQFCAEKSHNKSICKLDLQWKSKGNWQDVCANRKFSSHFQERYYRILLKCIYHRAQGFELTVFKTDFL